MKISLDKKQNVLPTTSKGGGCMLGKITENRSSKGSRYIVRFKKVFKRFDDLEEAERFLNALRYHSDQGTFDERDYQKGSPLAFSTLSEQWLKKREKEVRCLRNLKNHMSYACEFFKDTNIKEIDYPQLEDFFDQLPAHLSDKSKHNIKATLHSFFQWVVKRNRRAKVKIVMPEFPDIYFESEYRQIVDKTTQGRILQELQRITEFNPKIYIGALWLSTYINVRPIELIYIREGDIDLSNGIIEITHNKEMKPKRVYLLEEDVELIKSFPQVIDKNMYFFRHGKRKGVHKSKRVQFGKDYIYTWWRKACQNLGVEGVPLYPGTKHSTVVALGDECTPEEIKKYGTGHSSGKAFDRYFQVSAEKKRALFAKARCTTGAQQKRALKTV
jgi:integrase